MELQPPRGTDDLLPPRSDAMLGLYEHAHRLANLYGFRYLETPPVPVKDVRTVSDGDVLTFAGFRIEVLHTPGHTPGSVVYRTDGWVLSGDLVFAGSIGRSDFPNSSSPDMERSLRRFMELPDPTEVYPGHGPRTTVGRERERNPFLQGL